MSILDEVVGGTDTLLPEGHFTFRINHAAFHRDNTKIDNLKSEDCWLFLTAPDETELLRTGKQACRYVIQPRPDHSFTLSNVLIAQLSIGSDDAPLDWHQVLTKGTFPSSGQHFRDSLRSAIDEDVVRYVLDILPNTWPTFLPDQDEWLSTTKAQRQSNE